jgi:hypothetical protein
MTSSEELDALCLVKMPSPWEEHLKAVLVFRHGAGVLIQSQFMEGVGAQGRAVAEVEEVLEAAPGGDAFVGLDLGVPQLVPSSRL